MISRATLVLQDLVWILRNTLNKKIGGSPLEVRESITGWNSEIILNEALRKYINYIPIKCMLNIMEYSWSNPFATRILQRISLKYLMPIWVVWLDCLRNRYWNLGVWSFFRSWLVYFCTFRYAASDVSTFWHSITTSLDSTKFFSDSYFL